MSGFARGESIEEVWQWYPSQHELFRFLAYWVACFARLKVQPDLLAWLRWD